MKHKAHFIEDIPLNRKLAWLKQQLESDAMPEPSGLPGGVRSRLHGIISKLKSRIEISIGYEDEMGFHFGKPPNK